MTDDLKPSESDRDALRRLISETIYRRGQDNEALPSAAYDDITDAILAAGWRREAIGGSAGADNPATHPSRDQVLRAWRDLTRIILDTLKAPVGHEGDEEGGQCDEDCQRCAYDALRGCIEYHEDAWHDYLPPPASHGASTP